MGEPGQTRGDLTDVERVRLAEIRDQMNDAVGFLNDVMGGWNHGAKAEYRRVEETASAILAAREITEKLT